MKEQIQSQMKEGKPLPPQSQLVSQYDSSSDLVAQIEMLMQNGPSAAAANNKTAPANSTAPAKAPETANLQTDQETEKKQKSAIDIKAKKIKTKNQ